MKTTFLISVLIVMAILFTVQLHAQVGINTDGSQPDPSAGLDVKFINKGMLPPRMTTVQRDAIPSPATGLIIYNLDCNDVQFFNGSAWVPLGNSGEVDPPGAVTGKSSPCMYASGEVYSVAEVPGATGYTWMVPPGATISHGQGTDSITVDFGSSDGTICVSAVSSCLKSNMSCLNITLIPGSELAVSISSNVNPACSEAAYTFTASVSGNVVNPLYQWNVNGTDVPGETNSTYSFPPVLNNRIECKVTSYESCIAGFTATGFQVFKGCQPVCYGEPIRLSCPFPAGGCGAMGSSYHWENSSGSWISSDQDPVIQFGETGYGADLFYLTVNYSPPAGAVSKAMFFTEILSPIVVGGDATPVSCFGQGNGTITLTVSGGSAPYSFLWNDAAATQNRTGIGPGIYSVTVTDALFCLNHDSLTNTFIISEPVNSLSVTGTITAVSCYGACDGGVAISDSGGTPPYTYAWSNSTAEQNVSGLCAGTYTVTVTDARLCQVSANWTLENPTFAAPAPGVQVPGEHQVVWNWFPAATATGYRFNTTNDYGSAIDLGTDTTHTETGIICNTSFTRYVWAYNACEVSPPATLTMATVDCWTCGDSITVNHTAGDIAPVSKSATYGTVINIPGEAEKCWITGNLGASHPASAVNDATEASAGWYWQFNQKQGYMHDGTTRTPGTPWNASISGNSDWQAANDPCKLEMGENWRIPTFTEWTNVDWDGNWTNPADAWNSGLKLHNAGYLANSNGSLSQRGSEGDYQSSSQFMATAAWMLSFSTSSNNCYVSPGNKSLGLTMRCLRACPAPETPTEGIHTPSDTQIIWNWSSVPGATGYKWNTSNDFETAIDAGTATTKTETGLTCNTGYTRYVWAYNDCSASGATTLTQSTISGAGCLAACGTPICINHVAGAVAPASKTVTYSTVANIPGEPSKCWITSNLGADHQATAMDDATEASAGWYWEFNHKQGFMPDGGTVSPLSAWITLFYENSDWIITNDPCSIELGAGWRIPTFTEYSNIDNAGGWNDWNGPWNSVLKIHAAGHVPSRTVNPPVSGRGISGNYWSSTGGSDWNAGDFALSGSYCQTTYYNFKAGGFPLRCLRNGD